MGKGQQWFACILLLTGIVFAPIMAGAELNILMLKNAVYSTVAWNTPDRFEHRVKLVNGKYEHQGPYGVTDHEEVEMGKTAFGDLNGDGKNDAAVILYHNTGGSGTVTQVAAVLDVNGQPQHIASRNLGDRTEIKKLTIKKGIIFVTVDNPRFFPGQKKTVKYRLVGNKLIGPEPFK